MKQLKEMVTNIKTQPSDGSQNYLIGTKTNCLDAMKELKNFIFKMYSDNTKYNYFFTNTSGQLTKYTQTYNNCKRGDLVMVTSYETYNSLIAASTIFQDVEQVRKYFGVTELVVLPESWYDVDLGQEADPTIKGVLKDNDVFYDTVAGTRTKGAILVFDRRNLVRAYNWEYYDSQKYIMPANVEFVGNKNFDFKFLKWGQCALYVNENLEKDFALPVQVIQP